VGHRGVGVAGALAAGPAAGRGGGGGRRRARGAPRPPQPARTASTAVASSLRADILAIVSTFDRVADLPFVVESHELERLKQAVSTEFVRVTVHVRLRGAGEEGIGEDVTYDGEAHDRLLAGPPPSLEGEWTIRSFSEHLEGLDFWPEAPGMAAFRDYRRWAFESAALDLALRQAGRSLADALGLAPRPVRFVVSMRLGEPSSAEPIRRLLAEYPGTRLKLDPVPDWSPELVADLAGLGLVDVVDLKGQYSGTIVDNPADPELYLRVAEGFPEAWIEDPALTEETDAVLAAHRDRITWDAPIHSVADIEDLPFPPRTINVKPSRFGTVERLFDTYDYCAARGIGMYGGGQFELGVGRGHIQYLASLFHPDTPNDVAPRGFNQPQLPDGMPQSPIRIEPAPTGFRFA
jgi:L-alanine-DL-glutamate epimerase-like enolase superfamily enzyme